MTIIVLLILAGVSLNAIIGDNGVITNAMDAKMKNGMAILEEFLQEKYVENFDKFSEKENKALELMNIYSNYFYVPSLANVGSLQYVVDKDGHALYLINKEGLPQEIKDVLIGGETKDKEYSDYASLNDVYGVTGELKVYYCSSGINSIVGIAKEELDFDNPQREVFGKNSQMSKLLEKYDGLNEQPKDGIINSTEAKGIDKLTITKEDGVTSLDGIYNLVNLSELTLENLSLNNLDGVENASLLNYLFLKSCVIENYTAIGKIGSRLNYLYFYDINDDELRKVCSEETGIGRYNLENLNYFAIVGNTQYINSVEDKYIITRNSPKFITTLEPLSNLSKATKEAVKYLSLQCNEISNIKELKDLKNLYLLRIEGNKIKTLGEKDSKGAVDGLWNLSELSYLYANSNLLGNDEVVNTEGEVVTGKNSNKDSLACLENTKPHLYYLRLNSNIELKYVEYLSKITTLRFLYLDGCQKLENVACLRGIFGITDVKYTIDNIYSLDLIDENTQILDLSNKTMRLSSLEGLSSCSSLYKLNLENIKLTDSSDIVITNNELINTSLNNLLSELTAMEYLRLKGITALSSISFIKKGGEENIKELDLRGTSVKDLTPLTNFGSSLESLILDNENTDLGNIGPVVSGITKYAWDIGGWNKSGCGLLICSEGLYSKLGTIRNLTSLTLLNNLFYPQLIDLHELTNLKLLKGTFGGNTKVWLSKSLTKLTLSNMTTNNIFSFNDPRLPLETNIDSNVSLEHFGSNAVPGSGMVLASSWRFLKGTKVNELQFGASIYDCVWNFNDIIGCGIDVSSVKVLQSGYTDRNNRGAHDLSGVENFINLEKFNYENIIIKNLSPLYGLKKLYFLVCSNASLISISGIGTLTSLRELYLPNNSISNLYGLKDLTSLEALDLSYNTIDDQDFIVDGERFNNLDILANLNSGQNGSLTSLNLVGCKNIIDFSKLKALSWTSHVGF